ncbi:MAG: hypothetical protein GX896_06795 [Clostridiales bacterium]|nr:hypothetical protein [Clostridiales bacterium]
MENNKKELEKRYEEEMRNFKPVTIQDLDCKDCAFAFKEPNLISVCEIFPRQKPGNVLYGEKCDQHS